MTVQFDLWQQFATHLETEPDIHLKFVSIMLK